MIQPETEVCADREDLLRVDALLFELSTRFINLAADQVDGEIQNAQHHICEYLGIHRSALWRATEAAPDTWKLTHIYQDSEMPSITATGDAKAVVPWLFDQVRRGRTIAIADLDDLPPEAETDREALRTHGTRSTLIVPLEAENTVFGALTFASSQVRVSWPHGLIRRLQLVAEVFANALSRARTDEALRESRERFALAVAGANDGLWDWNLLTGRVYLSPRWKSMLGYAEHELANAVSSWEALIHPEDRDRTLAALSAHLAGQTPFFEAEHRLRGKDGDYVWILARGAALRDAHGRPCRMAGSHTDINSRKQAEQQLRQTLEELQRLRDQLQQQNVYLRREVSELHGRTSVIGQSRTLQRVLVQVEQVAPTGSTVLLLGETGTGKELIASALHELSPRRKHVMISVNCAAIPASLLESELFGREKGAYTGALSKQIGRFELANHSTLFLDEIGDLPAEVQAKLLRVLQEKYIERLGSHKPIPVDVRIITATNRDLEKAVRDGKFREDLYYRLNVFPIALPPLRDRREDIPLLVSAFVQEFAARFGKNIESIARESLAALERYSWPGNVRELRNVIERAMIVSQQPTLWIDPPGRSGTLAPAASLSMKETEYHHIRQVLDMTGWRIRGKNGAAELLGLKPSTLESRMAKLGIRRPDTNHTK